MLASKQTAKTKTESTTSVSTSATITIPSTLNDRVPAVPNVEDYLKKEETKETETVPKSRIRNTSPPSSNEQVSASYTLITPSFLRTRVSSVGSDDSEKGKVSVSYTIPVATAATISEGKSTSVTRITSKENVATKDDKCSEEIGKSVTTASVTATFNVPLSNSLASRKSSDTSTEITIEKPKASPTTKIRFKWEPEEKSSVPTDTMSESSGIKPVPATRFNSDYSTHRSYVRDKRSIFDIDHTNSTLTLAEKLRIEAIKYADTSRSSSDLPFTRSDSAESDTVTKKYDSVPSSPAHHATERRPSWRLRLDPNSKV